MTTHASLIHDTLQRLASLPPGTEPFLSLYLDMRTDGGGTHPGLTYLRTALVRQGRALGQRGAAVESFQSDAERVQQYVDSVLDRSHQGLALFACHARGIFEAVALPLAPQNSVVVAQSPRLYQLARLVDDYRPYCVALLSRTRARVFTVALGDITLNAELHQSDREVTKIQAGGWWKGTYQRRVENTIAEFAEDVAARLAQVCEAEHISRVVVGGEVTALAALERALPAAIGKLAISIDRMDAGLPEHAVLLRTMPAMADVAREGEAQAVAELLDLAAHGELAVVGVEPVIYALQQGAADELVLSDSFSAKGWRCTNCLTYGSGGTPSTCPACNAAVVQVDLNESLAGNATRLHVPIEFVRPGTQLDGSGGVGAFLRYPLP